MMRMQRIIIHHEYASIIKKPNQSLSISLASKRPLLRVNSGCDYNQNLNNHWTAYYHKNKIIICKRNDSDNIIDLEYKYYDIKQGYTSIRILRNFE